MQQKKLKILFFFMMIFCAKTYSRTIFNTANHIVVIYKILDPLVVAVDPVEKLTVSATSIDPFLYSRTSSKKKPINLKVERPFNQRDNILDAIFNKATLEMHNQGQFELKETKDGTKKIDAKGFFTDNDSHKITIQLIYSGGVDKYQGNTNLDVWFNEKKEKIDMGTYKGVLKVDVLYGG